MKHSNMDTKITLYDYVLIYEYIGSLLKCQNLFNENVQNFILLLINDCYEAADYSNYFRRRQFRKILHFYRVAWVCLQKEQPVQIWTWHSCLLANGTETCPLGPQRHRT